MAAGRRRDALASLTDWDVPDKGDCLFASIERFTPGISVAALRQRAAEHIGAHPGAFLQSVSDLRELRCYKAGAGHGLIHVDNFSEYVAQMKQAGTWGGEPEIRALSQSLNRTVVVWSDQARHYCSIHDAGVRQDDPIIIKRVGESHYHALEGKQSDRQAAYAAAKAHNDRLNAEPIAASAAASAKKKKGGKKPPVGPAGAAALGKKEGDARPGYKGTEYQILWTVETVLAAISDEDTTVEVNTEEAGFGNFDDVVVHHGDGSVTAIQVKCNTTGEERHYSASDFLSAAAEPTMKVALAHYFDSWWKVCVSADKGRTFNFELRSNYGWPNSSDDDKAFMACIDPKTGKFKAEFLSGALHPALLYRLQESLLRQSKSLRAYIEQESKVSPKMRKSKKYDFFATCLQPVTYFIGAAGVADGFHDQAAAWLKTQLAAKSKQWNLVLTPGFKKAKVEEWRAHLYPVLQAQAKKGNCQFRAAFFEAAADTSTGSLCAKLRQAVRDSRKSRSKWSDGRCDRFLQELVVTTPESDWRCIRVRSVTVQQPKNEALHATVQEWMCQFLSDVTLQLAVPDLSTLKARVRRRIFAVAKSVEEHHFLSMMSQVRDWFCHASQDTPLTKARVDAFLAEGGPALMQMYLVAHTQSHKRSQPTLPPVLNAAAIFGPNYAVLDGFMRAEDHWMILTAKPNQGAGMMVHQYFQDRGYPSGSYWVLDAEQFDSATHMSALRSDTARVLVLDQADMLDSAVREALVKAVEDTGKKLVLIYNAVPKLTALPMIEALCVPSVGDEPKLLEQSVAYKGGTVLSALPSGLRQQLLSQFGTLCRTIGKSAQALVVPACSRSVDAKAFSGGYTPSAGAHRVRWYALSCLQQVTTATTVHYPPEDHDAVVSALNVVGCHQLADGAEPEAEAWYFALADFDGSQANVLRLAEAGDEMHADDYELALQGEVWCCTPTSGKILDQPVVVSTAQAIDEVIQALPALLAEDAGPVLVEGAAGLGKSRLAYELSSRSDHWSVLLRAQDVDLSRGDDMPLADWVCRCLQNDGVTSAALDLIHAGVQRGAVQIIVDGLDELTPYQRAHHPRLLAQVMSYPALLALGRPEGYRPGRQFREITLDEFSPSQLDAFVRAQVAVDGAEAKHIVDTAMEHHDLLQVPLHAKMFCDLVQEDLLPEAVTQASLYQQFELLTLRRYLAREGTAADVLRSPARIVRRTRDEVASLKHLAMARVGWLSAAWQSEEDTRLSALGTDGLWEDMTNLGILAGAQSAEARRFLHASYQEYFAAQRVVGCLSAPSSSKDADLVQQLVRYWHTPAYARIWRFVESLIPPGSPAATQLATYRHALGVWFLGDTIVVDDADASTSVSSASSIAAKAGGHVASDFETLLDDDMAAPKSYRKGRGDTADKHDGDFYQAAEKLREMPLTRTRRKYLAGWLVDEFGVCARRADRHSYTVLDAIGNLMFRHQLASLAGGKDFVMHLSSLLPESAKKYRGYSEAKAALAQNQYDLPQLLGEDADTVTGWHWRDQSAYIAQLERLLKEPGNTLHRDAVWQRLVHMVAYGKWTPKNEALTVLMSMAKSGWQGFDTVRWRDDVLACLQPDQKPYKIDDLVGALLSYLEQEGLLAESRTIDGLVPVLTTMFEHTWGGDCSQAARAWKAILDIGPTLPPAFFTLVTDEIGDDGEKLLEAAELGPVFFADADWQTRIAEAIVAAMPHGIDGVRDAARLLRLWQRYFQIETIQESMADSIASHPAIVAQAYADVASAPDAIVLLLRMSTDVDEAKQGVFVDAICAVVHTHRVNVIAYEGALTISDRQSVVTVAMPAEDIAQRLKLQLKPEGAEAVPALAVGAMLMSEAGASAAAEGGASTPP